MDPEDRANTRARIELMLDQIAHYASIGDHENAHGKEDAMMLEFVQWAERAGGWEVMIMASLVLRSQDLEFERWTS